MTKSTIVILVLLNLMFLGAPRGAQALGPGSNTGLKFEISGSGSLVHFEFTPAGAKPAVTKVSVAQIVNCIEGNPAADPQSVQCNSTNLDIDVGGKAFLYVPDSAQDKVYISTNPACNNLTELDGVVGGNGQFMYGGKHSKSETNIIVQGTVTFDKTQFPSLVPLGIKKASILAVSDLLNHYGIGTFVTVGASTPVACLP